LSEDRTTARRSRKRGNGTDRREADRFFADRVTHGVRRLAVFEGPIVVSSVHAVVLFDHRSDDAVDLCRSFFANGSGNPHLGDPGTDRVSAHSACKHRIDKQLELIYIVLIVP
tara:strand:- start:685 stop:1023 length:339 start_codon:yes stop_codon:yes gene_type:complete